MDSLINKWTTSEIGVCIKIVATEEKYVKQYFAISSNRFQKVVVVVLKLSCKQDTKRKNGNCLQLNHTNSPAKQ